MDPMELESRRTIKIKVYEELTTREVAVKLLSRLGEIGILIAVLEGSITLVIRYRALADHVALRIGSIALGCLIASWILRQRP